MTTNEIRQRFIKFFEEKEHAVLPSSPLIPKDDPSVLLTTAGMQQFKTWFADASKAKSKRAATIQKCVRTNDIEEVGDETHLTFFEMLGNFSFGDYFKEDAITWGLQFIEKELGVDRKRIWVSIFEGDSEVPRDDDSERIWKSLGITDIREFGREDNFWGPTGTEGPCGPTTEIYVDDVEVWNLVFNEFYMQPDGVLLPLTQKGVDTGAGLERVSATINGLPSVFETDELAELGEFVSGLMPKGDQKAKRVITDHLRTATFLLADGVRPSNLDRGYILRRLIRRAVRYGKLSGVEDKICSRVAEKVIDTYKSNYQNLESEKAKIISELDLEEDKFRKVIQKGNEALAKITARINAERVDNLERRAITGEESFELFATYGFPIELTQEVAAEQGIAVDEAAFSAEFEKHQEVSRAGMEKKFSSGLENKEDPTIVKYHTAAHLMLAALREVLGDHVHQKGSNITAERIRFDFSHPEKMTDEQKQKVEEWVNDKIEKGLPVSVCEITPKEAKAKGAEGEFLERYGDVVTVYTIGGELGSGSEVSSEICTGPHVENTSELGHFRIKKEESSSSGVRRIKAVLE
jgi:alanyl-tRNA synthetase